jgi:hypothetical protein
VVALGEKVDNGVAFGEKMPKGGAPNSKGWLKNVVESAVIEGLVM